MSNCCTKRPPHVLFVDLMRFAKQQVCMYVCMYHVDETERQAGKSDATSWTWSGLQKQTLHLGEVTNITRYCGTPAVHVEPDLDRYWRQEQRSQTPTTNILQLEIASCWRKVHTSEMHPNRLPTYVCMCVYVCMYVCFMYVCMHICMHVCMYTICIYVCMKALKCNTLTIRQVPTILKHYAI